VGDDLVLLHELLSASLRLLERRIAGRRVRIVTQIDRTTPEVRADRERLREVIDTLLAEAAACTRDGGRVRVCLKHNRAALMISIKDDGAGMSRHEAEALFTDADRAPAPGAPLTLVKCRTAASSLGGNVFANAAPGKGSTFYLTLPPPKADDEPG